MHCLTCRHLLVADFDDARRFVCGHDSQSDIDSHKPAESIVSFEFGSEVTAIETPTWCPLRPSYAIQNTREECGVK